MRKSVCVCTYNGEKYIKEQLDSIIAQSVCVDEIIVSDDASTDNTMAIVQEVLQASNIEYKINVNTPNLGVTKNFEKAVSLASGDIVFFSDQDDIWLDNKVEKHLATYDDNKKANVCFTNAYLYDGEKILTDELFDRFGLGGKKKRKFASSQISALLMGWYVTGATMSAKKEFLTSIMPFPTYILHDQWISFRAALSDSLALLDECLIKYRQHSDQVIGAKELSTIDAIKEKVDSNYEIDVYSRLCDGVDDAHSVELIRGKIKYLKDRDIIKNGSAPSRIIRAVAYLLSGKYSKYSHNALKSCAKDILWR